MRMRAWAVEAAWYLVTIVLTTAIMIKAFHIRPRNIDVPQAWVGDALYTQVFIQNFLETGDPHLSDRTGAPYSTNLNDFPVAEAVHLNIIRALSLISTDPCWLVNVFYYLGFPLTAATAFLTLRTLGIGRIVAMIGSILYAFLPWHYYRFGHLFLASYYMIPPTVLVAVWVCQGQLTRNRWIASVIIGLIASGCGVYYAFFGCFFLIVAGIARAARDRRFVSIVPALILVVVISGGLLSQIAPALRSQQVQGRNPDVAARHPFEADIYGLRVVYLLMPTRNHQITRFGKLFEAYTNTSPFGPGESGGSAMGLIAAAGFVGLILLFLFNPHRPAGTLPHTLALFVMAGIILANVAGFAYLFAFFITPKIRCYNRISIYLSFFALAAVCLVLNRLVELAKVRGKVWHCGAVVGGLILLVGGLLDQAPRPFFRRLPEPPNPVTPIREFVQKIEATVPPNSMILQLPHVSFPEALGVHATHCYDHFRTAIYSRSLRWSYGAVRGRYPDAVQASLGRRPIEEIVEQAALMGYVGIHFDKFGYLERGAAEIAKLRQLLKTEPIVCNNDRDLYFDLRGYIQESRSRLGSTSWEEKQTDASNPTEVSLWSGSTAFNPSDPHRARLFFTGIGSFELFNPLDQPRTITLRFDPASPGAAVTELRLNGGPIDCVDQIGPNFAEVKHVIVVPPGKHRVVITAVRDEKPVYFVVNRFDVINHPLTSGGKGVARRQGE